MHSGPRARQPDDEEARWRGHRSEQVGTWSARATARQDVAPFIAADVTAIRDAAVVEEEVEPGTRLLAAGDRVDRVLVIGSGEVELRAHSPGGRRVLAIVRRGGVIGDIPLFLDAPMPFDAVVSRRALVCELDRQALLAFLSSAPSASLRWMRSIALPTASSRSSSTSRDCAASPALSRWSGSRG